MALTPDQHETTTVPIKTTTLAHLVDCEMMLEHLAECPDFDLIVDELPAHRRLMLASVLEVIRSHAGERGGSI